MASLYPDVLGFISSDARLTVECVQVALGVYPKQVAVGQPFELLILFQNLCDHSITTKITIQLPRRNPAGERLSLFTPRDTFDVSLAPGEVGLQHVPIRPQLPTPVGQNYPLAVRVEANHPRGAKFVRNPNGGRAPGAFSMSPYRLTILQQEVGFAANRANTTTGANTLMANFDILPGQIVQNTTDLSPRYEVLWDVKHLSQDQVAYAAIEAQTRELVQSFTRVMLYEPLQNETLRRFSAAGLPLMPGEVMAIAKIMTYTMEDGLEIEPGFSLASSIWFQRLTLFRTNEALLNNTERLIAALYTAVIEDAGRLGYTLLAQRLGQPINSTPMNRPNRATKPLDNPLGLPEDQAAHIIEIGDALDRLLPLDLTHVYWPLGLAGVLLHMSIRGPKENLWKTLDEVRSAWHSRSTTGLPHASTMANLMADALQNAEQTLTRMHLPRESATDVTDDE
jgi:hypothetical protein